MLGFKVYKTVIMAGSNKKVNAEIAGIIDMVTGRRIGRSRRRRLDENHPTMFVIKRFTSAEKYRQAKVLIERHYPAMCAFDVNI